jgi:transcriptional regulator with XRE-family HTH domain
MAQKVGCSHVHLLKIERGEKTPSPKLLDQLKRELGLDTFFIAYSNPSSISANFIEHDELIRLPLATGTVVALILDALLKGGFKPTLHKPDKMSPHPVNSLTIDVDLATGGRITIPIKHVT